MTYSERSDYGYKLRTLRIAVGLTQLEVGEACGFIGDTATRTVQFWERGERLPGIDRIRSLAAVLQVPVNQVVP